MAKVGEVDASTNGLDSDQLAQASQLGTWLTQWEDLSFTNADPDDLRELAADYKATGLGSKKVGTLLRDAAELIEDGKTAAQKRRYQTALTAYSKATEKLKAVPPRLRDDLKKAETMTGARVSPHADERFDGYDHLVPVETSAQEVSVLGWVDGDTVQTSAGRVRLIGIDTPEMKDQCPRAQWAKQYAESLAPVGSTITLTNPTSVDDKDRYSRLLRYVEVPLPDGKGDNVIDVGYSLIKSALAIARYDSRDGYQWHPRERLYHRNSGSAAEESGTCNPNAEKAAFIVAATLSQDEDSPEYWHKRILGRVLLAPYRSAKRHLPNAVAATRKEHEKQDRREREAQQRERERESQERARERAAEQRERQYSDNTDQDSSDGDDGSGGVDPGYNGPRCYAPGGKTWKPC